MKGQVWSMDYTIGFLFFMVTFFIVGTLLARAFLFDDGFDETYIAANAASEYLLSTGYPEHWREDDLILAGLITNGKVSMRKARSLAMVAQNQNDLRNALNSKLPIAIILRDQQNQIISLDVNCSIGNLESVYTIETRNKSLAYYYADNDQLLDEATTLGATIYQEHQIQSLLDNINTYELVILEQPNLAKQEDPSQQRKTQILQTFIEHGGDLLIIGNLNLSDFLATNATTQTSSYRQSNGSLFNLTENLTTIANAYAIADAGYNRYTAISSLPDTTDLIATYAIGDGDVHYLGTLTATLNDTLVAFEDHFATQLTYFSRPLTAECTSVTPPTADNIVSIKRLAALQGSIITIEVIAWQ